MHGNMTSRYRIILRFISPFPWEKDEQIIGYADDLGLVRYLKAEYQRIYGKNWSVRYERVVSLTEPSGLCGG